MRTLRRHLVPAAAVLTLVTALVTVPDVASAGPSVRPFGVMKTSATTTTVSNIGSSEVTLTDLNLAFSNPGESPYGSRYMKVTAVLRLAATTAPATADVYVDLTNTTVSPDVTYRVGTASAYLPITGGAGAETVVVTGYGIFGAGYSWTGSVKVKRTAGAGTVSVAQPAGGLQELIVEDMGSIF